MSERAPQGWKRSKVTVRVGKDGWTAAPSRETEPGDVRDKSVSGYVSAKAPGLALTVTQGMSLPGWRVTHGPTGYSLFGGPSFRTLADAARVAEAVAPLTDWTADFDAILALSRRRSFASKVHGAALAARDQPASPPAKRRSRKKL